LCDERGALLLFDEVQTGYGRTGRFLAQEWSGVVPDACSLAKGIAGGFPMGAMLVRESLGGALPPGSHASTFGGNPLACAAGLAVLSIMDDEGLVAHSDRLGEWLRARLGAIVERCPESAVEVRGRGLLVGVVLAERVDPLATLARLRDRRVLLSLAGGNVLRLSPPLVVDEGQLDEGLRLLESVLTDPPLREGDKAP
jgi:acetylornithine/succinyldiaminopimelate/putrescine aminotransferase